MLKAHLPSKLMCWKCNYQLNTARKRYPMRGTQIMKIPSGGYPTDPGRENNLQDSLSCLMSGREETTGSTPDADIYF